MYRFSYIQAASLFVLLVAAAPTVAAPFEAGAARRSITPPPDIGHVSLGGFGARQGAAYQGVHDEVFARTLALKGGEVACVIVALDRLEVPPGLHADVCEAVAGRAGEPADGLLVQPENLIITASHTHSAPENLARNGDSLPWAFGRFNEKLYEWTVEQIAAAVIEAVGALRSASVGSSQVRLEGLAANRREDALTDPDLTVVWISSDDDAPIAALVNFTAHPTILGAENLLISGEWPGEAERVVEQALGGGAVCLFTNGAEGDQSPAGEFGSGFDRVEGYGRRVAERIAATRAGVRMDDNPVLVLASKEVELPEREASPAYLKSVGGEYPIPPALIERVLGALFPGKARLQAVRLGDALLVTVPGEMIAALGLELKNTARERGIRHPFVAGLANTYCGYILTPEEYDEGGYESGVSVYGRDFGNRLVDELSALIAEVTE